MSQETRSVLKALVAIFFVVVLIAVGFIPLAGDGEGRRFWVFVYALVAVGLGLWRMVLTIWMHRDDAPTAVEAQQRTHRNQALLLDVFMVVFGAPAALLGAFSFLISTQH
ncbi:hypothetical protein [Microbacterium sp. AG238]|uniref:hypothetical protein n=1 Tax=Microbacterium sp. AG238 TaxID=2183994 RepID=UPI000E7494C0|nr:hypothetical protein [Microbacterium sp. AG238]